jgi:hypothetical protein
LEYPRSPDLGVDATPPTRSFVIAVADRQRRFLPAVFGIDVPFVAPVPSFPDTTPGPPIPLLDAYLFSAPTRPVTTGMCAIRADLWDHAANTPASNAVLRVQVGDRSGIGVAGMDGKILVLLPSPLVERLRLGSPPGTSQDAPQGQTWPVTVEAWYWPNLALPFGTRPVLPAPWTSLPSLKAILDGQTLGSIYADTTSAPAANWQGDAQYDTELILRTQPVSELWINRGSSPP